MPTKSNRSFGGLAISEVGRRVMCLACGLMLKKKLQSLTIELFVILNHLEVIHLWQPQKNDQFCEPHVLGPILSIFKNEQ